MTHWVFKCFCLNHLYSFIFNSVFIPSTCCLRAAQCVWASETLNFKSWRDTKWENWVMKTGKRQPAGLWTSCDHVSACSLAAGCHSLFLICNLSSSLNWENGASLWSQRVTTGAETQTPKHTSELWGVQEPSRHIQFFLKVSVRKVIRLS